MAIKYADGKTTIRARNKVLVAVCVGILAGVIAAALGEWQVTLLAAWDAGALAYVLWTFAIVWAMSGQMTSEHAVREDPSRRTAHIVVLTASIGSLAAVGVMLAEAHGSSGVRQFTGIVFSILSVVISWLTIHTLFMLRYAELYYTKPVGGIDFLETKQPNYRDFAYLAFTMGMTFQVSDTSLRTTRIRKVALGHAMLSYVFGTVIVAATINLVAGLGS